MIELFNFPSLSITGILPAVVPTSNCDAPLSFKALIFELIKVSVLALLANSI